MASLRFDASLVARLELEAARRLLAAAVTLQSAHMHDLNRSNPRPHDQPAPRGQFPRKRIGNLQGNILLSASSARQVAQTMSVRVGYGAAGFYGIALARRGWLGLLDTLARERGHLAGIIGSGAVIQEAP